MAPLSPLVPGTNGDERPEIPALVPMLGDDQWGRRTTSRQSDAKSVAKSARHQWGRKARKLALDLGLGAKHRQKCRQKCQAPMGTNTLKTGSGSGIRGKTSPKVTSKASPKVPGTNGDGATIRYQEQGLAYCVGVYHYNEFTHNVIITSDTRINNYLKQNNN